MARARDPNRDKAFEIWQESGGSIKLKEIADQLSIAEGTVRGWKNKDKWDDRFNGTFQSKKRNAPIKTERSKKVTGQSEPPPVMEVENDNLTDKQRLFVLEYMRDFNITRAAMAAGYSKKTAHVVGWETLRNPKVQAEVQRQKEMRSTELGLDVQRIIAEYMKIAFADISEYVEFGQKDVPVIGIYGPVTDDDGKQLMQTVNYVSFKDSSEIDATIISEVKQGKDGVSVKLHDKLKAMAALEKYLGFMTEEDRLRVEKLKGEVKLLEQKATADTDKPIEILIKRKGGAS